MSFSGQDEYWVYLNVLNTNQPMEEIIEYCKDF